MMLRVLAAVLALVEDVFAGLLLYPLITGTAWGPWVQAATMLILAVVLFRYLCDARDARSVLARASFTFAALQVVLPISGWYYRPDLEGVFVASALIQAAIFSGIGLLLRRRPA